ncbi:MAG TPA: hypothetical protein VJ774_00105 [Actinomycetota bacterium]|nr:hypothetical protein [Actinomycetota bacterium]
MSFQREAAPSRSTGEGGVKEFGLHPYSVLQVLRGRRDDGGAAVFGETRVLR